MRDCANRSICFEVNSLGLGSGNGAQGFNLTVIEARRSPKIRESNGVRLNEMKLREGADGIVPPSEV